MVALPAFLAVTLPSPSTVATSSSLLVKVTWLMSGAAASLGVVYSFRVVEPPTVRLPLALPNLMPSGAVVTVTLQLAVYSPRVAVISASPSATAVTVPSSATVATVSLLLV